MKSQLFFYGEKIKNKLHLVMLRTLELDIVTPYEHEETSRTYLTFTHKSRRLASGTRSPPRAIFVENAPTEQE